MVVVTVQGAPPPPYVVSTYSSLGCQYVMETTEEHSISKDRKWGKEYLQLTGELDMRDGSAARLARLSRALGSKSEAASSKGRARVTAPSRQLGLASGSVRRSGRLSESVWS
jgi:hypothetical protein